ncbi:hypothetical protein NYP20_16355 [Pseudomonas sp. N3-W]|uniref:hypothetical protein n=1 Tax=Pseudomonas sp. N3-W TaxID=2975049 RepID=UPI00217D3193|nr:hypothetical protein [Pseudomonas sp. N3-W]UWF46922.1 hypothetical protein NYP20_16355 [Pseudomonas sp. N3-W]
MVEGECKLCGEHRELKLSHFIPKFVGKWVKDSSATGYIRLNQNINKRAQDIAKDYWLCGECEQLFSGWEREFANKIFYPFVKNETDSAFYGEWLAKFCASLSWRTLSYMRSMNPRSDKVVDEKEKVVLRGLASFLLGKTSNLGIFEQHFYPLDAIDSASVGVGLPENINRYLLRSMHMDVLVGDGQVMVYTKLPKFILLGLSNHSESKQMRSSRVSIREGKLFPQSYYWPKGFAEYMFGKAREISQLYRKINPNQQAVIEKTLTKNPERAAASETIAAFQHDLEMFGRAAFSPSNPDDSA